MSKSLSRIAKLTLVLLSSALENGFALKTL